MTLVRLLSICGWIFCKGGTLLAGYQNKAIKVGETMVDEPLHFQGGLTKRSYFNKTGMYLLMISKL